MRPRSFVFSTVVSVAAAATLSHAADLQLPAVPVGASLQVEFALTSGQAPIANVDVSLAVPSGCGGVSPARVTTDPSGKARFDFIAGAQPGVCRIIGSSGGTSVAGQTTIFRPEELVVGGAPLVQDLNWRAGNPLAFYVTMTAAGLPLQFLPVEIGQSAPGGPTVVGNTRLTTDASGALSVPVSEGSKLGVYDLPLTAAGQLRHLRLDQGRFPDIAQVSASRVYVQASNDPAVVVFPDGLPGPTCAAGAALKSFQHLYGPASGYVDFFNDALDIVLGCAGNPSVRVRIEYPDPIPADAQLLQYSNTVGVGPAWKQLPAQISGNAVTFNLSAFVDEGQSLKATVAMMLPGGGVAPAPPRVNDMWWGGPEESGWGLSIVQSPGFGRDPLYPSPPHDTFAAIFTYDDAGEPTWWVMTLGDWHTGRGPQFTAPAYGPVGTPWYAYEPAIIHVGAAAGRVKLDFSNADNGELNFTLNGVTGRKSIRRMLFGGAASVARPDVSGLWWGGYQQNGWGITILQQGDKLFNVWYTYDAANKPTWFVMPDGKWTSAASYEGRIYRPHGARWLGAAYDASKLQVIDVGSFTLNFAGEKAAFSFSLEGREGSLQLERNTSYHH